MYQTSTVRVLSISQWQAEKQWSCPNHQRLLSRLLLRLRQILVRGSRLRGVREHTKEVEDVEGDLTLAVHPCRRDENESDQSLWSAGDQAACGQVVCILRASAGPPASSPNAVRENKRDTIPGCPLSQPHPDQKPPLFECKDLVL